MNLRDATLTGLRPSPTSMLYGRTKDEQNLTCLHQLLPLKMSSTQFRGTPRPVQGSKSVTARPLGPTGQSDFNCCAYL
jgi:hypothetical protein